MLENLHDKGKFIQCAVGIRIDKMMNGTEQRPQKQINTCPVDFFLLRCQTN